MGLKNYTLLLSVVSIIHCVQKSPNYTHPSNPYNSNISANHKAPIVSTIHPHEASPTAHSDKTTIVIGNMAVHSLDEKTSAPIVASMKRIAAKNIEVVPWTTSTIPPQGQSNNQPPSKNNQAFYFDANVTELNWKKYPSIECRISALLATYPEKNILGFVNQKLEMTLTTQNQKRSPSNADFLAAGQSCVKLLFEHVMSKKVIPSFEKEMQSQ